MNDLIKILEFLETHSGAFLVIFTAVVAFSTILYAILTRKLVSETKKMREAQTEPNICVFIQPRPEWINFIDLVIQNIGSGTAHNIKFEVKSDFEYRGGQFLSELNIIKKGVKYLAPNQKIQFFLTSMVEKFDEKIKVPFEIIANYQSTMGKCFQDIYVIDFSVLVGLTQLGELPLYKIAKNIEKIREQIGTIQKDIHKLLNEKRTLGEEINGQRGKDG